MEPNPRLNRAVLEIVENQLRNNDPPETRETFDRLIAERHSRPEAKKLIASVVASEIFHILKNEEVFNHARYVKALGNLPEMPVEE